MDMSNVGIMLVFFVCVTLFSVSETTPVIEAVSLSQPEVMSKQIQKEDVGQMSGRSFSFVLMPMGKDYRSSSLIFGSLILPKHRQLQASLIPSQHRSQRKAKLLSSGLIRKKRWDFRSDGCHCDGYRVECMRDSYCQHKHSSRAWKCNQTCCGFTCVYLRDRNPHPRQNETRTHHYQQQQQQQQEKQSDPSNNDAGSSSTTTKHPKITIVDLHVVQAVANDADDEDDDGDDDDAISNNGSNDK